eukprot:COSAG01_NODE_24582_length_774_cov_0.552593_1_plen_68_part_10
MHCPSSHIGAGCRGRMKELLECLRATFPGHHWQLVGETVVQPPTGPVGGAAYVGVAPACPKTNGKAAS